MSPLDKEKLEKVLIIHWPEFIDSRQMLHFIRDTAVQHLNYGPNCQVKKVSFSRFEMQSDGFLIWTEVSISQGKSEINTTMEFFLTTEGNFIFNQIA